MGNCCGVLAEMNNLISGESHWNPPLGPLSCRESHYHLMSNMTFTVLKLFAVLISCWLESAKLRASVRQWSREKVWLDEEPRRLCLKRTQCFIWMWEDHFLSWGVGQCKQKVSRFGLDKFPRPFQLHYSIIVMTWSQFHSWSKGKSFLHWHLLQVLFAWGLRVCVPAAQ